MVGMTDCSFAHAAMVVPSRGSCIFAAVFPSFLLACRVYLTSSIEGLSFQGGIGVGGSTERQNFLVRTLELMFKEFVTELSDEKI